jgi:hypothetical protein
VGYLGPKVPSAIAFFIRLHHIEDPPLDYHPMKQYQSALIARSFFYDDLKTISKLKRAVAHSNLKNLRTKEPPVLEYLTSVAYRIMGSERLYIPRILSVCFWVVGGLILYLIMHSLIGKDGCLLPLAFYLFGPFGIFISRSIMVESLMTMLFLTGLLVMIRYCEKPSFRRLIIASFFCGLAVLTKFVMLFPVVGAFMAVSAHRNGFSASIKDRDVILFFVVVVLLGGLYYFYMILLPGSALRGAARTIFLPKLLFTSFFWMGWLKLISRTVGYAPFFLALVGIFLTKNGLLKFLLIGLFIGYAVYGLLFSYATATHDYYQIAIFPTVAIALGPFGVWIGRRLGHMDKVLVSLVVAICIVGVIFLVGFQLRYKVLTLTQKKLVEIASGVFYGNQRLYRIVCPDHKKTKVYQEIGKIVNHSVSCLILSHHYGLPLRYHAHICGRFWPSTGELRAHKLRGRPHLGAQERFRSHYFRGKPEYFIITDMEDFQKQKDLQRFLNSHFMLLIKNERYIIFDLRMTPGVTEKGPVFYNEDSENESAGTRNPYQGGAVNLIFPISFDQNRTSVRLRLISF